MNRQRKDGYVYAPKGEAFADLLYSIVAKLDSGAVPHEWAETVENIGKAMRK